MEKRYRVLRFVATLWKILAWVILLVGMLASIATLAGVLMGGAQLRSYFDSGIVPFSPVVGGIIAFVGGVLFSVFNFLAIYALGEFLHLLVGLEENTRATAAMLQQLRPATPPSGYPRAYAQPTAPSTPPPQGNNYS